MVKSQKNDPTKLKIRTPEEIRAKYRPAAAADASSAAAQARDKLVQRKDKLDKLSLHTEELQNEAANYSAKASELAKKMEDRNKWWKL